VFLVKQIDRDLDHLLILDDIREKLFFFALDYVNVVVEDVDELLTYFEQLQKLMKLTALLVHSLIPTFSVKKLQCTEKATTNLAV